MENPATWGRPERVIRAAILRHSKTRRERMCGLSIERQIADALRAEGLLNDTLIHENEWLRDELGRLGDELREATEGKWR